MLNTLLRLMNSQIIYSPHQWTTFPREDNSPKNKGEDSERRWVSPPVLKVPPEAVPNHIVSLIKNKYVRLKGAFAARTATKGICT